MFKLRGGGGIPKIEGGRGHAGICTGLRVRALIPRCLRESVCVCVGGGGGGRGSCNIFQRLFVQRFQRLFVQTYFSEII